MNEKICKYTTEQIKIRPGRKEDMSAVAEMSQELADSHNQPGPTVTVEELQRDGFELDPPAFRCWIAELNDGSVAQPVVGYAMYFPIYSSWEGRSMMLHDLYVKLDSRRRGIGERLFSAVAKEAKSTGCSRIEFHVLEWNPARTFYEGKGAVNLTLSEQWSYYRLAGPALDAAAEGQAKQNGA